MSVTGWGEWKEKEGGIGDGVDGMGGQTGWGEYGRTEVLPSTTTHPLVIFPPRSKEGARYTHRQEGSREVYAYCRPTVDVGQ